MKMTESEIYEARKQFFNDSAEKWIDMWYRDPETGEEKKHHKDFQRLFAMMPLAPGHCVLDAGCGTGVLVPYILNAIGNQGTLYALDFAENMIDVNSMRHPMENVRFLVSDVEHAPLEDASCDVVICFSCFPHFQDKALAIRTLGRILKPRGILIIAHFDSSEGINHRHKSCHAVMHDHLPGEAAMRTMIVRGGFDIEAFIDEKGFYYIQAVKK
jgi:demethylmenaquinone methyltransferase/2-methoxy-6-polyprenyl-1,4-benzoquinol methylase